MPYLAHLIHQLYQQDGEALSQAIWLVPHYALSQKIQTLFARERKKVDWGLTIYTPQDWLPKLYPLHVPHRLLLLTKLHALLAKKSSASLPFPHLIHWASQLLHDFDQLDRHLLNPATLLQIPTKGDPSPFSQTTSPNPHPITQRFRQDWNDLYPTYQTYKAQLLQEGLAYHGLHQREAAEKWSKENQPPAPRLIGIHLHPLSPAWQQICRHLATHMQVDLYYQTDAFYMDNPAQEAGYHLRHYATDPLFGKHCKPPYPSRIQNGKQKIQVINCSTQVGQTQATATLLQQWQQTQPHSFSFDQVGIVLPDTHCLIPLLHALPPTPSPITLRLDYPFTHTPLYAFLHALIQLQATWAHTHGQLTHSVSKALHLLMQHPYMANAPQDITQALHDWTAETTKPNRAPPHQSQLITLLRPLSPKSSPSLWTFLSQSLARIQPILPHQQAEQESSQIIWEHAQKFLQRLSDLPHLAPQHIPEALPFFQHQARQLTIPLRKETGGLEIVDMPQSIALEKPYIIILSMNEGILPPTPTHEPWLPKHFRESHGWPTPAATSSHTAYLFYRLLQQARHLALLHHQTKDAGKASEKSRYIWQLAYETSIPLVEKAHAHTALPPEIPPLVIPKTPDVIALLRPFFTNNPTPRTLTPTSINLYLDCPVCFYLQYIASIPPPPITNPKTLASLHFGKVWHQVLQILYQPYVGQLITPQLVQHISRHVTSQVRTTLAKAYEKENNRHQPPHRHLAEPIMEQLIQKVLAHDKAYAPFTLLGLEVGHKGELDYPHLLPNGEKINLGGVIDRVDRKGDIIRIIDYKSGKWSPRIQHIQHLFDPKTSPRNAIALQLFYYSWLYHHRYPDPANKVAIQPTVMGSRQLFTSHPTTSFAWQKDKNFHPITDAIPHFQPFQQGLDALLMELFNPDIPFSPHPSLHPQPASRFPFICQHLRE